MRSRRAVLFERDAIPVVVMTIKLLHETKHNHNKGDHSHVQKRKAAPRYEWAEHIDARSKSCLGAHIWN